MCLKLPLGWKENEHDENKAFKANSLTLYTGDATNLEKSLPVWSCDSHLIATPGVLGYFA